jgi:hypothetical protein
LTILWNTKLDKENFNYYIVDYISNESFLDINKLIFYRSLLCFFSSYIFVNIGKTYKNMMIDVKITNKKLYFRACRIIWEITNINEKDSEALLRRIVKIESNNKELSNLEDVINICSWIKNIVTKTILLYFYPHKSIKDIEVMIKWEPIIRKLIQNLI